MPTAVEGDRTVTEKMSYDLRLSITGLVLWRRADPQRGDSVTLGSQEEGVHLLKHVVGVPGDIIAMRNDVLYINSRSQAQLSPSAEERADMPDVADYVFRQEDVGGGEHAATFEPARWALRSFGSATVHAGKYFVLSDIRGDSKDSRYISFISERALADQVFAVCYSLEPADHCVLRFGSSLHVNSILE